MKLLALDTASAQCSVALMTGSDLIVREAQTARDHAQLILPMVDSVLADAGMKLAQLDGIAFGRGPGSFTGVRVAAAVTQGLALGADLPVLPISDLRALALQGLRAVQGVASHGDDAFVLACMDARMGEVYWATFAIQEGRLGVLLAAEIVSTPEQLLALCPRRCATAAGRGLAAWPQIAATLCLPEAAILAHGEPHAREVAALAMQELVNGARWLDAALAQPVYLRDSVASPKTQI